MFLTLCAHRLWKCASNPYANEIHSANVTVMSLAKKPEDRALIWGLWTTNSSAEVKSPTTGNTFLIFDGINHPIAVQSSVEGFHSR